MKNRNKVYFITEVRTGGATQFEDCLILYRLIANRYYGSEIKKLVSDAYDKSSCSFTLVDCDDLNKELIIHGDDIEKYESNIIGLEHSDRKFKLFTLTKDEWLLGKAITYQGIVPTPKTLLDDFDKAIDGFHFQYAFSSTYVECLEYKEGYIRRTFVDGNKMDICLAPSFIRLYLEQFGSQAIKNDILIVPAGKGKSFCYRVVDKPLLSKLLLK